MATRSRYSFQTHEVGINLELLKRYYIYPIFNPNSPKIFGWNIYRLLIILFTAVVQCIVIYGTLGIFFGMENLSTLSIIDNLITTLGLIGPLINFFKIIVIIFNADVIWDLLNVTRIHFLKSEQCSRFKEILYECRNRTIKITNLYSNFIIIIFLQWLLFPMVSYYFFKNFENENTQLQRQNVFNLWFPVSTRTFNEYFIIFYIFEMCIIFFIIYILIISDIFLMSFCWVISAQYNVLAQAFKYVATEDHNSQMEINREFSKLEDFKSIIFDQIQLDKKVKSYYLVLRPIIIVLVAINTSTIIVISYTFIVICTSTKLFSILNLMKLGSTNVFLTFQLFVYCYLLDKLNLAKESVNFGIYSCNWTNMNLKFKKLLLLTMRMNDANHLIMKLSPKKIVNLQLFASVISMSFNMVSVLLKTMKNEN